MGQPPRRVEPAEKLSELAQRAIGGDAAAFEELHRRLGGGLKQFLARRVGNNQDLVEELAQEAWVGAWRALRDERYDPTRAAFSTFLYAVGYKVFLRYLRERGRALPAGDAEPDQFPEEPRDLDELLDLSQHVEALRRELQRARTAGTLTDEELRILEGVSQGISERELAAELELAPSTLHARKKLAMSKLRKLLESGGSTRIPPSSEG